MEKTLHSASKRASVSKITDFREEGFSFPAIRVRVQRNSTPVIRVQKQWTKEHRTTRKTGRGRRKGTSMPDERNLLLMVVNDRSVSSRQLTARWSTATGVLMSASSIRLNESHFNLCDHASGIRVRRYAGERCFLECVIERHSSLTPGVMVCGRDFVSWTNQFDTN
ncbi:transposable element Tc1 transposase [Trichonephila clavipes]|nr:transposable element Tc1 transposase [Trichonephila clavipes]